MCATPNNIKVDSGERYMFKVTRTDGSAAHLHLFQNFFKYSNVIGAASLEYFLCSGASLVMSALKVQVLLA